MIWLGPAHCSSQEPLPLPPSPPAVAYILTISGNLLIFIFVNDFFVCRPFLKPLLNFFVTILLLLYVLVF